MPTNVLQVTFIMQISTRHLSWLNPTEQVSFVSLCLTACVICFYFVVNFFGQLFQCFIYFLLIFKVHSSGHIFWMWISVDFCGSYGQELLFLNSFGVPPPLTYSQYVTPHDKFSHVWNITHCPVSIRFFLFQNHPT